MNDITALRGLKMIALLSVLGLAVAGLSQCRLVGDAVTGVELNTQNATDGGADCVRLCLDQFKAGMREEANRHREAIRACKGSERDDDNDGDGENQDGEDETCIKAENARHQDAVKALLKTLDECKRACYDEGSGSGGQ